MTLFIFFHGNNNLIFYLYNISIRTNKNNLVAVIGSYYDARAVFKENSKNISFFRS